MASTQGIADLVGALTGGAGIENAAYDRQAARMLEAREKQAMLDKRMQEAALVADQMRSRGNFERNSMDMPPEVRFAIMAGMGSDFNQGTQGMLNQQEFTNRNRLEGARLDEGFTLGNAVANALQPTPNIVGTVERVGDLLVRGNQGANPQVEQIMTALNAAAGASADKTGALKGKEQEIAYYVNVLGMPMEEAVKKAYGRSRIALDQLGNVRSIDDTAPLAQAVTNVPIVGDTTGQPPPSPPAGSTLYELADVATGPTNYATGAAGRVADLIPGMGLPAFAKPTVEAQSKFQANMRSLVRSLAETRAFREQEYIMKELAASPGFLKGEDTLRSDITSLRQVLTTMLEQEERDASDPTVGQQAQKDAQLNATRIRNFLPILGGPGQATQQQITPELRNRAENALHDLPGFIEMPPERQDRLIELWIRDNGN